MVCRQSGGSHAPIFIVRGVTGNAWFDNLISHIGPDESIYALHEQDLDGQGPILTSIEAMAARFIREIKTVQPRGPYFVTGYSFGGLISFEMAQQLHAQGEDVPMVALLDTGQPIYRKDRARVLLSPGMLGTYIRRFAQLFTDPHSRRTIWSRIRNELWRVFFLKLRLRRQAGGTEGSGSRPLPRTTAMLQAANIEAAVNYQPKPFPGRLTLFRVEERTAIDRFDRFLGWSGLAADIDVYDIPGDHVTFGAEPFVGVLAEKFRLAIQAARDRKA